MLELLDLAFPTTRRGWGLTVAFIGAAFGVILVVFGPSPAGELGATGCGAAVVLGLLTVVDYRRGRWWAAAALLVLAATLGTYGATQQPY